MVPEEGVEPSRPQGSGDFESPASAIPPLRRGGGAAYRSPPVNVKCREVERAEVLPIQFVSATMGRSLEEARLDFKVGDKVVYPNHGVGVIEQVTKKSVGE